MSTLISDADYRVLQETISYNNNNRKYLKTLMSKIRVVREELIPKTTVKLNSMVLLWHSFLQKTVSIRIVPPDLADMAYKNISVFAPIMV
jgi:transcription elongation GreA/GreB family factor